MKNKKPIVNVVLGGTFAVSLMASASVPSVMAANSQFAGKTLTVVYQQFGGGTQTTTWFNKAIAQFKTQYPGANVKLEPINASENDYYTKLDLMNQSASTAPDVMVEDTFLVNSDAAAGYLMPMTNMVKHWSDWNKEFFKPMQAAAESSNGTVFGVPFNTDTRGIYYNKVLFKKAGLPVPWHPKTWQDVLNAAKAIKAKESGVVPLWFYSGKAMGEASTMQGFEMLLYGTKNTLYDFKTNKWIVKSKGFLDSLGFVQNIFQNGLAEPLQDALTPNSGVIATQKLMPKDQAAMLISGDWEYSNWLKTGAAPWPQWRSQIDVAPMPDQYGGGYSSLSGGWVLSISSKSKLSAMAFDFIKIATDKQNMAWIDVATSNITPRKDVSAMPAYKNAGQGMLAKFSKFNAFTVFRPANADYPKVSNEIMTEMENVMTGSMTPQQAMDDYAAKVTGLLGKNKVETQ